MQVYYDKDADLSIIQGKKVADVFVVGRIQPAPPTGGVVMIVVVSLVARRRRHMILAAHGTSFPTSGVAWATAVAGASLSANSSWAFTTHAAKASFDTTSTVIGMKP